MFGGLSLTRQRISQRASRVAAGFVWTILVVCAVPTVTFAQQTLEDFEQKGLDLGAFKLFPDLGLGMVFTDNVFAVPNSGTLFVNTATGELEDVPRDDDFIATITPTLNLRSDFRRHAINASIGGEIGKYFQFSSQDYEDFESEIGGVYEWTPVFSTFLEADYANLHESRTDEDARNIVQITEFDDYGFSGGFDLRKKRTRLRGFAGFRRLEFAQELESDRDRTALTGQLRGDYAMTRQLGTFALVRFVNTNFDRRGISGLTPQGQLVFDGINRDSNRLIARGGLTWDFAETLVGELGGGVDGASFSDPETDNQLRGGFDGSLAWNIDPLTTLDIGGGSRIVPNTGVGASGSLVVNAGVGLTRALSRRWTVSGGFDYDRNERIDNPRTDDTYTGVLATEYSFNRYLSVSGAYRYQQRESTINSNDFRINSAFLTVTGRL